MELKPCFYFGKVMHKRLLPKENLFSYKIYYLACPIKNLNQLQMGRLRVGVNRAGLLAFYDRDHGHCDGTTLEAWAREILKTYGLSEKIDNIVLVAMPRVLGYVFNPVSFWLCFNKSKQMLAVLCEVHNTFGEKHTYICANPDHTPINPETWLEADKVFHVSPMLKREGHYKFRFDQRNDNFGVWIDYYNSENNKQVITSLIGKFKPYTSENWSRAFWLYPLVTFKAILLIHWQAIKTLLKGIKYIHRPRQNPEKVSATKNLKKI